MFVFKYSRKCITIFYFIRFLHKCKFEKKGNACLSASCLFLSTVAPILTNQTDGSLWTEDRSFRLILLLSETVESCYKIVPSLYEPVFWRNPSHAQIHWFFLHRSHKLYRLVVVWSMMTGKFLIFLNFSLNVAKFKNYQSHKSFNHRAVSDCLLLILQLINDCGHYFLDQRQIEIRDFPE